MVRFIRDLYSNNSAVEVYDSFVPAKKCWHHQSFKLSANGKVLTKIKELLRMDNLTRWQRPGLPVWSPLGRLFSLSDDLDRLFDASFGYVSRASQSLTAGSAAIDLYQDKDNLIVTAELPGLKKEDIDVSLHDGALSISSERKSAEKTEKTGATPTGRFVGRFHRSIRLPAEVAADKVKAHYQDGILTISLPKAEAARPKQIEVSSN
jgi:HSP20 family protein